MLIRLTQFATPLQALAADDSRDRAILAFYLVVLAHNLRKKTKANLGQLAQKMYDEAGRPKAHSYAMTAIKKGTTTDISIATKGMDARLAKLARAIMRTERVGDDYYQEVARLASTVVAPEVAAMWVPEPVKPTKVKDPAEARKAENRFLRDLVIRDVRQGKKLPDVLNTLKANGAPIKLPATLVKSLGVLEDGSITYKGEPLVSRANSACTLWVLRGATIALPTNAAKADSYIFSYVPAVGTTAQKMYRLSSVIKANQKKWDAVSSLSKKLPKLKTAMNKGVLKKDPLACLLNFAFLTASRIGSESGSTAGTKTYGSSTLLVRHLAFKGPSCVITYPGKKGVQQQHVLKPNAETKPLLVFLKERQENATKDMLVFTADGKPFSNTAINSWLKAIIPTVTVHKFRHVRGTDLAEQVLERLKVPANIKQPAANALFKSAMEKVGHLLGHYNAKGEETKITSATALKNYIDPSVSAQWFKNLKLEVPKFIPKG